MLIAVLAAVSFGVGLADVIFTYITYCSGSTATACNSGNYNANVYPNALTFTWIFAGVWGSILVSIPIQPSQNCNNSI